MKKYLATVAAVGLIAGVGAANAQSPGSMEKKELPGASSGSPSQSSPAQQKQSPPVTESQPAQRGTVGQAPSAAPPKADMKSEQKSGDTKAGVSTDSKSGTSAQTDTKSGTSAGTKADTKSGTTTTGQAASGSINLTTQQRTEIREKVLVSAPKVTNVNFSLNVGTVVPRTVTLVTVPETLVVIHPQWRGYRYFVVREEIVIVEPDTLKIIAVIRV